MKDNNVRNDLKAEMSEKPEGCTILFEITEKPVRLYIMMRGSSAPLVS
jgi:hypothetical protein